MAKGLLDLASGQASLLCIVCPGWKTMFRRKQIKVLDSPCVGTTVLGALRVVRARLGTGGTPPWPHWGDLKKQIRARVAGAQGQRVNRVSLVALCFAEEPVGLLQSLGLLHAPSGLTVPLTEILVLYLHPQQ